MPDRNPASGGLIAYGWFCGMVKCVAHSGSGFAGFGRELGFAVPWDEEGERKFWQAQLDQTIEHWSGNHEDNGTPDAKFTAILTELSTIRKTLEQLLHDQAAS